MIQDGEQAKLRWGGVAPVELDTQYHNIEALHNAPSAYGNAIRTITIRDVLQHYTGWNPDRGDTLWKSFDDTNGGLTGQSWDGFMEMMCVAYKDDPNLDLPVFQGRPMTPDDLFKIVFDSDYWNTEVQSPEEGGKGWEFGYDEYTRFGLKKATYDNFNYMLAGELLQVVTGAKAEAEDETGEGFSFFRGYATWVTGHVLGPLAMCSTVPGSSTRFFAARSAVNEKDYPNEAPREVSYAGSGYPWKHPNDWWFDEDDSPFGITALFDMRQIEYHPDCGWPEGDDANPRSYWLWYDPNSDTTYDIRDRVNLPYGVFQGIDKVDDWPPEKCTPGQDYIAPSAELDAPPRWPYSRDVSPLRVTAPYGDPATQLELSLPAKGWVSTAADMAVFAGALSRFKAGDPNSPGMVDVSGANEILSRAMVEEMLTKPVTQDNGTDRVLGWALGAPRSYTKNDLNMTAVTAAVRVHSGLLSGTASYMAVREDGYAFAMMFNTDFRKVQGGTGEVIGRIQDHLDELAKNS